MDAHIHLVSGVSEVGKGDMILMETNFGILCIVKCASLQLEVASPPSLERRRLLHQETLFGADLVNQTTRVSH